MGHVPRRSAGLLVHHARDDGEIEVLLVHPGGPLWARRDQGWWSIPKGEVAEGEDDLAAAVREFQEELGIAPPHGPLRPLGDVVQAGGKPVVAWAIEGHLDVSALRPGTFEMEWPPRSGRRQRFPEIDRAAWFPLAQASHALLAGQRPFLDRLRAGVVDRPS